MIFLLLKGLRGYGSSPFNGVNNRSLGDCAATKFAPTAQVAAQQGTYLARLFNTMARTETLEAEIATLSKQQFSSSEVETKQKQLSKVKLMKPFEYSHQGNPLSSSCTDAQDHWRILAVTKRLRTYLSDSRVVISLQAVN